MNWFVGSKELADHFDDFINERFGELSLHFKNYTDKNALIALCKLILGNVPSSNTCSYICQRGSDCPETTSNYCRIKYNKKNKYDNADWRRQGTYFSQRIKVYKAELELILGHKRINYFLAPIMEKAVRDFESLGSRAREEWVEAHFKPEEITFEVVTISDVETDPWLKFVRSKIKEEKHLLC